MSSIAERAVAVVSGASGQGAEQRAELSRLLGLTVNFLAPQTASRFACHFSVDLHTAALADKAALHEDGNSHHEIAHGITLSRGWGLGNQGTRNEERGTSALAGGDGGATQGDVAGQKPPCGL